MIPVAQCHDWLRVFRPSFGWGVGVLDNADSTSSRISSYFADDRFAGEECAEELAVPEKIPCRSRMRRV